MKRSNRFRVLATLGSVVVVIAVVAACGASASTGDKTSAGKAHASAANSAASKNKEFKVPAVSNNTEYHNYYNAQKLYDDPTTIIWCTTTWGNANSPLVTVPIAGKLTSSSVSLLPSTVVQDADSSDSLSYFPEQVSVDGMYHGSPPPYRYGFTPGGQYVDFFNMPTLCTTQLTKFQRQSSNVTVTNDATADAAQKLAQTALAQCAKGQTLANPKAYSCPAAQQALESALGSADK